MSREPDERPAASAGRPSGSARPAPGWPRYERLGPPRRRRLGIERRRGTRHAGRGRRRRRGRLVGYLLVAVFAFVARHRRRLRARLLLLRRGRRQGHGRRPGGASLRAIAAELEAEGVVKHARAFVIRAESDGYATQFKPGTYMLPRNEPYEDLVALLEGRQAAHRQGHHPRGHHAEQAARIVPASVKAISAAGLRRASPATSRRRSRSRATSRARRSRACSSRRPTRCCPKKAPSAFVERSSRRSTRTSPRST